MPLLQLAVLATVAMAALATLRLVRLYLGRSPLPEGRGRRLFLLAFVIGPPLALGALTQPSSTPGLGGVTSLPLYIAILTSLAFLMWLVAQIVGQVTRSRAGRILRLALAGSEGEPAVPTDPPLTAKLAECVADVGRANAAFPRGPQFSSQVDREGFRVDWDALDGATRTLEDRIADDRGLGLDVASAATAVADDARSRLDTLHRVALDHGRTWAPAGG